MTVTSKRHLRRFAKIPVVYEHHTHTGYSCQNSAQTAKRRKKIPVFLHATPLFCETPLFGGNTRFSAGAARRFAQTVLFVGETPLFLRGRSILFKSSSGVLHLSSAELSGESFASNLQVQARQRFTQMNK